MTPGVRDALKSHRTKQTEERLKAGSAYQDRDLVFATEAGTPINPSNLHDRSFAPLLKKAGLPRITFHDLRHTTASLLFSRNVHPKFVQELLQRFAVQLDRNARDILTFAQSLFPVRNMAKDAGGSITVQTAIVHASVTFTLGTYSHMLPGMGGEAANAIGEALG